MRLAMLMGVLLAGVCSAVGAKDAQPLTFTTTARVEVDADGKLVKVEAAQDLPEPVRAYVERQIAQWKFAPNVREGVAGNAATWVTLGACALPQENGTYAMGIAFGGNGPRIAGGGKWRAPPDLFPIVVRSQIDGSADVNFIVHPDGTAKFESMEGLSDGRLRRQMTPVFKRWIADYRFDPEEIGGAPVTTRATITLSLLSGSANNTSEKAMLARTMASPACQRAGMPTVPGLNAIATDSVVSIVPTI